MLLFADSRRVAEKLQHLWSISSRVQQTRGWNCIKFQLYTNKLEVTYEETVYKIVKQLIENKNKYEKMSKRSNPYGDRFATNKLIADILELLQFSYIIII